MTLVALLAIAALAPAATPQYGYKVVHVYPHRRDAFTEGLEFRGGLLYESTGLEGQSTVTKIKVETGQVVQQIRLDPALFGEGITVINERMVQLTYKTELGFVYNQSSMRQLRTFHYRGEGWSLANDGAHIYMDDGSDQIRVWDPVTLAEQRRITVHDGPRNIENLNELEWVRGELYANIWKSDRVARISPSDGRVLGWIDLSGLLTPAEAVGVDVLNGIAYDSFGDRLFVTGKLWPKLFEIRLVRR
jgi:glutaminyl-peptide cyclotransferase